MAWFGSEAGFLSSFFLRDFSVGSENFASMEHFAQIRKSQYFKDAECEKRLWEEGQNPYKAKAIGRECGGYLESQNYVKYMGEQLQEGYYNLFRQNPDLKEALLDTWPLSLVEAGTDKLFGVGIPLNSKLIFHPKHYRGRNLAGTSLMAVRSKLRKEEWGEYRNPSSH